jgi:hypothetical protein
VAQAADYLPLATPEEGGRLAFLDRGRFHFYPRAAMGLTYDDNVRLRGTNAVGDLVGVVQSGMTLVLGETADTLGGGAEIRQASSFPTPDSISSMSRGLSLSSIGLSADYGARVSLYAENQDLNAADHVGRVNAVLPGERFSAQFLQDIQSLSETTVEVGTRQRYTAYQTLLGLTYELSEVTALGSSASYLFRQVEGGLGSTYLNGELHADHQLAGSARLGLGVSGGNTEQDGSSPEVFEQFRARFGYTVSDLINLDVSAGLEWRQYESGIASSSALPVFDLALSYAPTDRTRLGLRGGRRVLSSVFLEGENYVESSIGASFAQMVGERLTCRASVDYQNRDYAAAQSGASNSGTDNTWAGLVQADWALPGTLSISLFYRYRKNDTSVGSAGYSNNQVGFLLGWGY